MAAGYCAHGYCGVDNQIENHLLQLEPLCENVSDISWESCVVSEIRFCLTFASILSKTTRATELDSAFCLPAPVLVTSRAALGSCAKLRCRQSKETMVES
jgi:hypothetical protein